MTEEDILIYLYYKIIQIGLRNDFYYNPDDRKIKYLWKDIIKIKTIEELKEEKGFYSFEHYKNMYKHKYDINKNNRT